MPLYAVRCVVHEHPSAHSVDKRVFLCELLASLSSSQSCKLILNVNNPAISNSITLTIYNSSELYGFISMSQCSSILQVDPEQVIPAQGPLSVFAKYHDKRALFVGQGKLHEIANEYPFNLIS